MISLKIANRFSQWQAAARYLLKNNIHPDQVSWCEQSDSQFDIWGETENKSTFVTSPLNGIHVSKRFMRLANYVACHRYVGRWALLYRVLWRLTHGEKELLKFSIDPDIYHLLKMERAVHRDIHKMKAFLRFQEVTGSVQKYYIAWFEPAHYIVEHTASFFIDRFRIMNWSILTPDQCAHWQNGNLFFSSKAEKLANTNEDDIKALWLTYYENIFNPSRLNTRTTQQHMPKRYWKNLPETTLIDKLEREAPARTRAMVLNGK